MNTIGYAFILAGLVLSICAIAYACLQYNIEESRQRGFMMKACTDAGGKWDGRACQYMVVNATQT